MKTRIVAIGALLVSAIACAAPDFVIATNSLPQAVVVVAPDAPQTTVKAANMLADFLGRLGKTKFMVATKAVPGYKSILVGTPYKSAKQEEIFIRVKDANTLEVTGNGPLGIQYAVQDLVEHFGVVFCNAEYDYIPDVAGLALPGDFKKVDAPWLVGRGMNPWQPLKNPEYIMKLRHNVAPLLTWMLGDYGGGTQLYWGSNRYYKLFPEHHAFNEKGERKIHHWFCASDEALYPKLIAEVEKDILAGRKMISLGVDDGGDACKCAKCEKLSLVVTEDYPEGRLYPALQNIYLVNRVARHFKDKYPDVVFSIMAYWEFPSAPPPSVGMLEPNVGIAIALLWRNYGRPVSACERSLLQHDDWAKLLPENTKAGLYIWDYYANFCTFMMPFPVTQTMGMNMRHYRKQKVAMINPQTQFMAWGDMTQLNFWLLSQLYWNPDQDDEALIDKYLNAAYGKAAPHVREYLNIINHARDRNFGVWVGCYQPNNNHWLTGEDCVRVMMAWDRARAATWHGDRNHRRSVFYGRIAPVTMALLRWNDMVEPAKKMRYRLPSRKALYAEWTKIMGAATMEKEYQDPAEANRFAYIDKNGKRVGRSFETFFEQLIASPTNATDYAQKKLFYSFNADKMTGGSKMKKMKDADGTSYARVTVNLKDRIGDLWMRPDLGEAGVTLTKEHEGEWYVFATVRTGATVAYDRGSAYLGIYRLSGIVQSDPSAGNQMEIANIPVVGRKGQNGWQTICIGKYILIDKTRIWMMNGILHATDYADIKNISLVSPSIIEGGTNPLKPVSSKEATIIPVRQFANARALKIAREKYDNYEYARVNEAAPALPEVKIKKEDAGEKNVFALVRVTSDVLFDADAAKIELFAPQGDNSTNMPISQVTIKSEFGNPGWQLVSLGKQILTEGSTLRFNPAIKPELKGADIRSFILMDPKVMK